MSCDLYYYLIGGLQCTEKPVSKEKMINSLLLNDFLCNNLLVESCCGLQKRLDVVSKATCSLIAANGFVSKANPENATAETFS